MEIHCPRCGSRAPDNKSQFCDKCGNKLPDALPQSTITACIHCGKKAPSGNSLFCDYCGTVLPQPKTVNYGKVCPNCRRMAPAAGSVFCDVCGTRLKDLPPHTAGITPLPSPEYPPLRPEIHPPGPSAVTDQETPVSRAGKNSPWSTFILRFALVFGIVAFFIDPLIGIAVVIVSAYAVYHDARELRAGSFTEKVEIVKPLSWRPSDWGFLVLAAWIFGLPFYLLKREGLFLVFAHGGIPPAPSGGAGAEPLTELPAVPPAVPGTAPAAGSQKEQEGLPPSAPGQGPEPEPVPALPAEPSRITAAEPVQFSTVSGFVHEETHDAGSTGTAPETTEPEEEVRPAVPAMRPADETAGRESGIPETVDDSTNRKPLLAPRARLALVAVVIIAVLVVVAVVAPGLVPKVGDLPPLNITLPETISLPSTSVSSPTVNVLSVGESVSDGKQKLTVHGVTKQDTIGSATPATLDKSYKGYTFYIVDITVENLQWTDEITNDAFYLLNNEGFLYPSEQVPGLDALYNGTGIRPLEKRRGNLAFAVPADPGELRLKNEVGSSIVALYLLG